MFTFDRRSHSSAPKIKKETNKALSSTDELANDYDNYTPSTQQWSAYASNARYLVTTIINTTLWFSGLVFAILIFITLNNIDYNKMQLARGVDEAGIGRYMNVSNLGHLRVTLENQQLVSESGQPITLAVSILDPGVEEIKGSASQETKSIYVAGLSEQTPNNPDDADAITTRIISPLSDQDYSHNDDTNLFFTTATRLSVASTSTQDTSNGDGARVLHFYGLDSSYAEIDETVTMQGTTRVHTAQSYIRIHRITVSTIGGGGRDSNIGTITCYKKDTDTKASVILPGLGATLNGFYTIPVGFVGAVRQVKSTVYQNDYASNTVSRLRLVTQEPGKGAITHLSKSVVNSDTDDSFTSYVGPFSEKTDVYVVIDNFNTGAEQTIHAMASISIIITKNYET